MLSLLSSIADFSDLVPHFKFFKNKPYPERVIFDVREFGAEREGEHRYVNRTEGLMFGQGSSGWSTGVFRIAIRTLTPCGLRRLGMTQKFIINDFGQFECPAAEEVPIRLIMPLNNFYAGGQEFTFEDDLPAGTEIRLKVDFDELTAELRVNDWSSGVIRIDPTTITAPLYPYFLLDAGDAFEVLPPE
eukprot:EG_transcript_12968